MDNIYKVKNKSFEVIKELDDIGLCLEYIKMLFLNKFKNTTDFVIDVSRYKELYKVKIKCENIKGTYYITY